MSKKSKDTKDTKKSKDSKNIKKTKPETTKVKFYGRFNVEKRYLNYFSHIAKGNIRYNSKDEPIIELKTDTFNIQAVLLDDSKIREYITNMKNITIGNILSRLSLINKFDKDKKEGFQTDIDSLKSDLFSMLKDQIKKGKIGLSKVKDSMSYLDKDSKAEIKELWNKKTNL